MTKTEQYKALQIRYVQIDNEARNIMQPIVFENQKQQDKIDLLFREAIEQVQPKLDKLYNEQSEVEEKLELLEDIMFKCEFCGEYVEHYNKEALENGYNYGDCCVGQLIRCENCESLGVFGENSGPNGIHVCEVCGREYCDNCERPCDCEEE